LPPPLASVGGGAGNVTVRALIAGMTVCLQGLGRGGGRVGATKHARCSSDCKPQARLAALAVRPGRWRPLQGQALTGNHTASSQGSTASQGLPANQTREDKQEPWAAQPHVTSSQAGRQAHGVKPLVPGLT
jgi:hypothetical protein